MKSRILVCLFALLSVPALQALVPYDTPAVPSEPEQFQVTEKTEVPNTTLTPGSYSIKILDHLRDRVILQVTGKNHVQVTFLAIPAATMANSPVGPIPYSTGPKGKAALKGFSFPGGTAVEFVYPKNDAVSIAQANGTRVMAIDPASEGRVPAPKLNQNDMQMITLWMLEPARVGPSDAKPTISASRYQAPQPAAVQAPVQTAQSEPAPAPAPAPAASAPVTPATSAYTQPASTAGVRPAARHSHAFQLAQNDVPPALQPARTHVRPAGVKTLPHTASALPLVWLAAFVSLFAAAGLSLRRLAFQR